MSPGAGLGGLRRLATPRPEPAPTEAAAAAPAVEHCEMCAAEIADQHGHVADTAEHRLLCVCRPCHLLFTRDGAGGARFRGVGTDSRVVTDLALDELDWARLQIPVELAFFLTTGDDGVTSLFYPGPSGATESLLDLADWRPIVEANPVLSSVTTDTEAVLLRHLTPGFVCYVVPVDRCYELVGIVRAHWVGLAGGVEVWSRIDAFFDDLATRSRPVTREG